MSLQRIRIASGLIAVIAALFAWGATDEARTRLEVVVAMSTHGTVRVTGAPGDEIPVILTGSSVEKRWSSETGLSLEIGDSRIPLVQPRPKDWDDSITVRGDSLDEFRIEISVRIPEGAPGTLTEGLIAGEVTFPYPVDIDEFDNRTQVVEIPIALAAVSGENAEARRAVARGPYPTIASISLVIAIVAGIVFFVATSLQVFRSNPAPRP